MKTLIFALVVIAGIAWGSAVTQGVETIQNDRIDRIEMAVNG